MHLVKEGLYGEVVGRIGNDDVEPRDRMWYAGYCMGLLQANYLTQDEHDCLVSDIMELFDEHEQKGGANG